MSLRSKKRRRWARECGRAAAHFAERLRLELAAAERAIKRVLRDAPETWPRRIAEYQDTLIIHTPEYMARMARKTGRPWP